MSSINYPYISFTTGKNIRNFWGLNHDSRDINLSEEDENEEFVRKHDPSKSFVPIEEILDQNDVFESVAGKIDGELNIDYLIDSEFEEPEESEIPSIIGENNLM